MFHKTFRIKSQTAIKGSDRKKLRTEIAHQYPNIPAEQLPVLVPNKEEMSVMKLYSHSGHNVIVYILQKTPIFFELDKEIFPTVYLLWKHPEMMPVLCTWPQVFPKLLGGADLMLPGIVVHGNLSPTNLGNLSKNQPCAIKLVGNKAPMAVGRTVISSADMIYDAGMKGKGVHMIHTYQDQLWALGDKTPPPLIKDEDFQPYLNDEDEEDTADENKQAEHCYNPNSSIDNEQETVIQNSENSKSAICDMDNLNLKEVEATDLDEDICSSNIIDGEDDQVSIQEKMDELLYWCFCCAIKTKVKKSDLPLLTSNFYKNYLQACCPSGKNVDIKKSNYKKLGKFLAAMKSKGFINLKEYSKGVESIIEVNKDHEELKGFNVNEFELVADAKAEKVDGAVPSFQPPVITELFIITANTLPFFRAYGFKKGSPIKAAEIRESITKYVKENELKTEGPSVTLDGPLSDLVLNKGEYIETLTWEDLFSRCQSRCSPGYEVAAMGMPPVLKKGKLEPIILNVAVRAGKKKVTMVENLEVYGIDPSEFAHRIQKGMACSASTSPLPGKGRGLQVLIQGNQINYVVNLLLEKYLLKRKWIQGTEKAVKEKRKK